MILCLFLILILYKINRLIIGLDHDHSTIYKQNINICLPFYNNFFYQMSVLYNGFKLCQMLLNINIHRFCNLKLFKCYVKSIGLYSL